MKKILVFIMFLSLSLGAAAQDNPWQWSPDDSGAQDRTVVIADLVVNGNNVDINALDSHYLIGAFIDGQCRGMATTVTNSGKRWLQIEIFGNYGHTDDSGKPVSFRLYDKDSKKEYVLNSSRQVVWDQATYGMPSADHVVLSAWTTQDEAIVTFPAIVNLSKLHDVQVTFTHTNPQEAVLNPAMVEVIIADGPHGWTAATATGSGLQWTMRGLAVGEYEYYVTYGGRRMLSDNGLQTGELIIPAEVTFENGWDWISLFVPTSFALTDPSTGDYLSWLNIDSDNQVIEIRSQQASIYNDPEMGIFGDITQLTAADGAYKIKSIYDDNHTSTKVLNLGTSVDGDATSAMMPMVEPGYTWIGYPHEQDHSLATLKGVLSSTASEGDRIIGHNEFIEYDGYQWVGSLQTFEAGKGYIYYTENETPFHLNWGDYYLPQESITNTFHPAVASPWYFDCHRHASSMPVVASIDIPLDMMADGARFGIGAFVGNDCRGYSYIADGEHLFISISGNTGEVVNFKLYDHQTGHFIDLEESLHYGSSAGSLRDPMQLHASTDAIHTLTTGRSQLRLTYDGHHITVGGNNGQPTFSVVHLSSAMQLHITSQGTSLSTDALPSGIYAVTVTDGTSSKTIKIIK